MQKTRITHPFKGLLALIILACSSAAWADPTGNIGIGVGKTQHQVGQPQTVMPSK